LSWSFEVILLHQHKQSKKSKSDNWWTPELAYADLCRIYQFFAILDVCATSASSKCDWYIDRNTNALLTDWLVRGKRVLCFCNPPNKELGKFIDRCYHQFKTLGVQTMLIVPLNTQTSKAWWRSVQLPMEKGEKIMVRPMDKRINFEHDGHKGDSSINGYAVVIFGRKNTHLKKQFKR